jgi:hypothetical protein
MLAQPPRAAAPSTPARAVRTMSTAAISRRRSTRSTMAPECSEKSSQGSCAQKASAATWTGSRVREAARSGSATREIPSPRLETVEALQSRA